MRLNLVRSIALTAALLVHQTAWATPSRLAALEENQLFEDDTDIFLLPGVVPIYARQLTLHVGAGGPQGGILHSAGESSWAFGVFHSTRALYDDLARTAEMVNRPILRPSKILTFAIGKKFGSNAMGLTLTPSVGLRRNIPPRGTGAADQTFSAALDLTFGFSRHLANSHSDTALSIEYHRYQSYVATKPFEDTPAGPSIALRHRMITVSDGLLNWGAYGEAARRDESFRQHEPFTSVANIERWVLMLGAGPRIKPIPQIVIAASGQLSWNQVRGKVDRSRFGFGNLTFPGLKLAIEANPLEWLFFRAGVTRNFQIVLSRPQTDGEADRSAEAYVWSTGIGIMKGDFQLDATISNALLTAGPNFIGGGAPGLFGGLSARYHY